LRMKTTPFRIATMIATAALALAGCNPPRSGIVILPVKSEEQQKIEAHWKDIHEILKENGNLYYIEEYRRGNFVGKEGSLPEILRVDEIGDHRVASDFTGHAFQIGIGLAPVKSSVGYVGHPDALPRVSPTPQTKGMGSHLHLNKEIDLSVELVKAVEDELKKPAPPQPVEH
jgi:hypothetical protein